MPHSLIPDSTPFFDTGKRPPRISSHVEGLALTLLLSAFTPLAQADAALAKSRNCMACHQADAKSLGPSYRDIARRHAGQADAPARLAKSIRSGSKGNWPPERGAPVPMPPNPHVKQEEADRLARWILTQPSPGR